MAIVLSSSSLLLVAVVVVTMMVVVTVRLLPVVMAGGGGGAGGSEWSSHKKLVRRRTRFSDRLRFFFAVENGIDRPSRDGGHQARTATSDQPASQRRGESERRDISIHYYYRVCAGLTRKQVLARRLLSDRYSKPPYNLVP
jgi:hypothetical protein